MMTEMDHEQAERTHAAERYALRDMPAQEAEQFELHFFRCALCAEQLESLRALAVNARVAPGKVVPLPARKPTASSRWWPVATAAGWAVAAVLGWQLFGVPSASRGVEPMAAYALRSVSRGEPNRVTVPPGISRFALYFDPVWDARPGSYQLQIAGTVQRQLILPAPPPGQPLYLSLDRSTLPPGRYQLTVTDPAGARLAFLEFELQLLSTR